MIWSIIALLFWAFQVVLGATVLILLVIAFAQLAWDKLGRKLFD